MSFGSLCCIMMLCLISARGGRSQPAVLADLHAVFDLENNATREVSQPASRVGGHLVSVLQVFKSSLAEGPLGRVFADEGEPPLSTRVAASKAVPGLIALMENLFSAGDTSAAGSTRAAAARAAINTDAQQAFVRNLHADRSRREAKRLLGAEAVPSLADRRKRAGERTPRELGAAHAPPAYYTRDVGSPFPVFLDATQHAAERYADVVLALLADISNRDPRAAAGWDGTLATVPPVFFARCSGVGIFIPSSTSLGPSSAYFCNGVPVSQAAYSGLTGLQASATSGPNSTVNSAAATTSLARTVSALSVAAAVNDTQSPLLVALAASPAARAPLPVALSNNLSALSPAQRSALAVALNISATGLSQLRNVSQLLPADAVTAAAVLTILGPSNSALLLAANGGVAQCNTSTSGSTSPGTPLWSASDFSAVPGTCACPLDYGGAECEHALHYSCAATLAEPLFHVCEALNGQGFAAPGAHSATPAGTLSGLGAGSGVAVPTFLTGVLGTSGGSATADAALVAALHRRWGSRSVESNGYSVNALTGQREKPAHRAQTNTGLGDSSLQRYDSAGHGQPPCLHANKATVLAQGVAAVMPFAFRVTCGFHSGNNASAALSSGQGLADPLGRPYTYLAAAAASDGSAPASIALNSTAAVALGYRPPIIPSSGTGAAPAHRCNGTAMTVAFVSAQLAPLGLNTSSPGLLPPWYGLSCLERVFTYVVGGPQPGATAVPFSLSYPPVLPLAVRLRAVSPTYVTDTSGVGLALVPPAALTGQQPVVVALRPAEFSEDADLWAGGRLRMEAAVVQLPEGLSPSPHSAGASAQLADAGYGSLAASAGSAFPYRPADLALVLQPHPPARWLTVADLTNASNPNASAGLLPASGEWLWRGIAPYRLAPRPRLALSGVSSLAVDDSSWQAPATASTSSLVLGLVLGLLVPGLLGGFGAWRWARARKGRAAALEQEAIHDRMMAAQVARATAAQLQVHFPPPGPTTSPQPAPARGSRPEASTGAATPSDENLWASPLARAVIAPLPDSGHDLHAGQGSSTRLPRHTGRGGLSAAVANPLAQLQGSAENPAASASRDDVVGTTLPGALTDVVLTSGEANGSDSEAEASEGQGAEAASAHGQSHPLPRRWRTQPHI
jgi:hypothetical protein